MPESASPPEPQPGAVPAAGAGDFDARAAAVAAIDVAHLVVAVVDAGGTVLHLTGAGPEAGAGPDVAAGRPFAELFPTPREHVGVTALLRRALAGERVSQAEVPWSPPGGAQRVLSWSAAARPGPDGPVVVAVAVDVTERRRAEDELTWRAFHDPLTGLANRALLRDRLLHATERLARATHVVAVMLLDVDDFKAVNDTHGHEVGDRVLVALADRMRAAVRPGDTVARLGGDEFVVLCEDLEDPSVAVAVADRVAEAVGPPYRVGDIEVGVHISVGLAVAGSGSRDPEDVLRRADEAMYRAKRAGRAPAPPPDGS